MHVALNGWFWDQPNTGSGQYIRRLVKNMLQIAPQHQFTLILPPHHRPSASADAASAGEAASEKLNVIQTSGMKGKIGKVWFEQRTFPNAVQACGADIAHVPYWGPPLASPARLITSVLDVIPLALPSYSGTLATRLYTSLVTAGARGSSHILTLSEAAKADIVQYIGVPPEMITPTYLATDDAFHPRMGAESDAQVREKYNLPERFVLYIGGFDRRKNVNDLMLAYTYVRQAEGDAVPLVMAGREPAWGTSVFPDLRAYAKELNIEDTLMWIGYVDEADKPALMRLATVVAYPSLYEGFGLPVLEAMASGTPVVASGIPVMREIVGDGAYLIDSPRAMAGAILALLNQPSFYDSMVNQGLAQATRYSWRKTARETLEVYEKVMAL